MAKAPRSLSPRSCGLNAHARSKVRFGLTDDPGSRRDVQGAKRTQHSRSGARNPDDLHFIESVSVTSLST